MMKNIIALMIESTVTSISRKWEAGIALTGPQTVVCNVKIKYVFYPQCVIQ